MTLYRGASWGATTIGDVHLRVLMNRPDGSSPRRLSSATYRAEFGSSGWSGRSGSRRKDRAETALDGGTVAAATATRARTPAPAQGACGGAVGPPGGGTRSGYTPSSSRKTSPGHPLFDPCGWGRPVGRAPARERRPPRPLESARGTWPRQTGTAAAARLTLPLRKGSRDPEAGRSAARGRAGRGWSAAGAPPLPA